MKQDYIQHAKDVTVDASDLLSTKNAQNDAHCGHFCMEDDACFSFGYSDSDGSCELYRKLFDHLNVSPTPGKHEVLEKYPQVNESQ